MLLGSEHSMPGWECSCGRAGEIGVASNWCSAGGAGARCHAVSRCWYQITRNRVFALSLPAFGAFVDKQALMGFTHECPAQPPEQLPTAVIGA
ncbi:Uncharacterised protein [Mycobacteroides abscessus subsp. abscessus]|nr:Uncharacterised protein [Mycobacteroides abscessus subsp. abscessus]